MKLILSFNPSQVQFTQQQKIQNRPPQPPFQSLTGSIHTFWGLFNSLGDFKFQSLTGSIHTLKNSALPSNSPVRFNPSQVQFTQEIKDILSQRYGVFQSLTGSIHTLV